eukprot:1619113-Pyramimonas_sp.AAC.1
MSRELPRPVGCEEPPLRGGGGALGHADCDGGAAEPSAPRFLGHGGRHRRTDGRLGFSCRAQ